MTMELKIQLKQKVWKNTKPTKEGYTHDWIVMVQGVKGDKLKNIVQKVEFHLPDIYPDNKRIKKEPPFFVSDSTSQSLRIQIDLFLSPELKLDKKSYIYEILISDDENVVTKRLVFKDLSIKMIEEILLAGGDIKVEPQDDVQIAMAVDEATSNTAKESGNLQNKCNLSSAAQLHYDKVLEINRKLKELNMKLKERSANQEKLIACYEKQTACYETFNVHDAMAINQLKKKLEDDERVISALRLQIEVLQAEAMKIQSCGTENDG